MITVCMLLLDLHAMDPPVSMVCTGGVHGNMLVLFFVLSSFGRPHGP